MERARDGTASRAVPTPAARWSETPSHSGPSASGRRRARGPDWSASRGVGRASPQPRGAGSRSGWRQRGGPPLASHIAGTSASWTAPPHAHGSADDPCGGVDLVLVRKRGEDRGADDRRQHDDRQTEHEVPALQADEVVATVRRPPGATRNPSRSRAPPTRRAWRRPPASRRPPRARRPLHACRALPSASRGTSPSA